MKLREKGIVIAAALGAAGVTPGAFGGLVTIDFDGTGAPLAFAQTTALRDLFAGLGVRFRGPGERDGGAILNQDSNFGVPARSGTDFLAFNRKAVLQDGGIPTDPETLLFDDLQVTISIYAAGGRDASTFRMDAFDQFDRLVDSDTVRTQDYSQLTVSSNQGIVKVVLTELNDGGDQGWVYDDLSFEALPAPSALAFLGLAGLAGARRRR